MPTSRERLRQLVAEDKAAARTRSDLNALATLSRLARTDRKGAAKSLLHDFGERGPMFEKFINRLLDAMTVPFSFDHDYIVVESKPRGRWSFVVAQSHEAFEGETIPVFSAPGLYELGRGLVEILTEAA
jgi:hypothetical protein